MPDFFLDEFLTANQPPAEQNKPSAGGKSGQVEQVFKTIMSIANDDIVKKTNAVYAFRVKVGDDYADWYLDLKTGAGSAGKGAPPSPADATLIMDGADFVKMFQGNYY